MNRECMCMQSYQCWTCWLKGVRPESEANSDSPPVVNLPDATVSPTPLSNESSKEPGVEVGRKADQGKPKYSKLFRKPLITAVTHLVRVLEYGAEKYPSEDNWVQVDNGRERYRDAAFRHLAARVGGEVLDPESGLPHMACAACSCLFALALEEG